MIAVALAAAVSLHATRLPAGRGPGSVVALDVDGDRRADLVVANEASGDVSVLLGDGQGGFASPGPQFPTGRMPYQRVRAADVNGDGRADVATADGKHDQLTLLLSHATVAP